MKLGETTREPNPVNLDPRLARVSGGVHRLDGQLMVILDVDHVLEWLGGNAGRIGTVRAADRNAGTLNATRW